MDFGSYSALIWIALIGVLVILVGALAGNEICLRRYGKRHSTPEENGRNGRNHS